MRAPSTNRISQTQHLVSKAVDYSAKPDPNVYAPESGRIDSYMQRGTGKSDAGMVLRLKGKTGMHSFCHLEKAYVKPGDTVKEGQKIAKMGYTGYTIPEGPGGAHLHYYVLTPNGYVYPPKLYDKEKESKKMYKGKTAKQWYTDYDNRGKKIVGYQQKVARLEAEIKALKDGSNVESVWTKVKAAFGK